jgi:hypothetical protein
MGESTKYRAPTRFEDRIVHNAADGWDGKDFEAGRREL